MTQPTPAPPTLTYQTPHPYGNAPLLVRLAAIFTLVAAGTDLLGTAWSAVTLAIMYIATQFDTASGAAIPPRGPAPFPGPQAVMWISLAIHGGAFLIGLLCTVVKTVAGIQLLRHSRRAWAWGLAAGILGSFPLSSFLSCSLFCLLSLPAGIYTLVVMCLQHVRRFLADANAR